MTGLRRDEQLRRYFIEAAADGAPADLLRRSLARTSAARQRHEWWGRAPAGLPIFRAAPPPLRWGAVAVVLAFVGGGLVGGLVLDTAPSPTPSPPASANPSVPATPRPTTEVNPEGIAKLLPGPHAVTEFEPQFDYVMPDTDLGYASSPSSWLVEWVDAANPALANHGVAILWVEEATVHGCVNGVRGDRIAVRSSPAAFLADLRDVAGAGIGAITSSTLDGRPALSAQLMPSGLPEGVVPCPNPDVHAGYEFGFTYVMLDEPAELIVAEIDGVSVLLKIWARTAEDLATWMPLGRALVDSIRFRPQ